MSVSSVLAVSMMIGTVLRERIARQTSKPSIRGSITSSTTRSKLSSRRRSSASRPSSAGMTSYPSLRSGYASSFWTDSSSSTSRMRGAAALNPQNCRLRRSDRAAGIQGGVRSGPPGDRSGHVLVREQTEGLAAGAGGGRALRRRPGGRPCDPNRDRRPGPAGRHARGPRDRPARGGCVRRTRVQRRARGTTRGAALHARGTRSRERDRACAPDARVARS